MSLQTFGCPDCSQPFQVESSQTGQQVRCPGCNTVVKIPDAMGKPEATESFPPPPDSSEVPEAYACPACESAFGVLASMYGTTMACPHCGQAVAIEPAPPSDVPRVNVTDATVPIDDAAPIVVTVKQQSPFSIRTEDSIKTEVGSPLEQLNTEQEDIEPNVVMFEPQNVDHLLPPRFATLDPAFVNRRSASSDQVLLPHSDGGIHAVSNRIVTIVHKGREYQLISSPRYRRNLGIAVNVILILIAALLMLALWWTI